MKRMAISFLLLFLAIGLNAQVYCFSNPVDSPVLSSGPDDIPATGVNVLTYTGSHAAARANTTFGFVQINTNDQRVWFSPDASPGLHKIFYNRRYRADANSPWYWQFSVSPLIWDFTSQASAGPSSVLYSATPRYVDTRNGESYEFIAYYAYQSDACNNHVFGVVEVAFSHNGICWTNPQMVHDYTSNTGDPCVGDTSAIPIEMIAAFDQGTYIYTIAVEGRASQLGVPSQMNRTQTYIRYSSPATPATASPLPLPEITANGMLRPSMSYCSPAGDRFSPYNYFMNLQGAYDAANGDLYLGRGYPYPYDRSPYSNPNYQAVPMPYQATVYTMLDPATGLQAGVAGCLPGLSTLPNRIQIYKMHIGTLGRIDLLNSGQWTLVADYGHNAGYGNIAPGCSADPSPLYQGQTSIGRDVGAVTLIRDGAGNVVRDGSGNVQVLAGDTFELSKSHGQCYVTGLERQTLLTVP